MKEVRLSIPLIGGPTVIYTGEEVEAKRVALKKHLSGFTSSIICLVNRVLTPEVIGTPAALGTIGQGKRSERSNIVWKLKLPQFLSK